MSPGNNTEYESVQNPATRSGPSVLYFHEFPVEIVQKIFETAAAHRPTACALAQVSKTVWDWVTPILYLTVRLPYRHPARNKDRDRIRANQTWLHTRNLFLQPNTFHRLSDVDADEPSAWSSSFAIYPSVLSTTRSLESLVICNTDLHRYKLNFKSPALSRVIILGPLSYMRFPKELFATVTHLYLADNFPQNDCPEFIPENLPELRQLICTAGTRCANTLAIPDFRFHKWAVRHITALASTFTTLRLVGIHLADAYRDPAQDFDIDSLCEDLHHPLEGRLLIKPAERFDEQVWEEWVNGAETVWDRADRELGGLSKLCPA